MTALTRRTAMSSASVAALTVVLFLVFAVAPSLSSPVTSAAASVDCDPTEPTSCSLRELATRAGIRLGATAEANETLDSHYSDVLSREFNSLTPENAMKWYSLQATPGTWTFSDAETVVEFARTHGLELRGHTLVWAQDQYTPAWVRGITDTGELQRVMESQIGTTMQHFAGRVHRWDVVNEPLASLGTGHSASVFWSLGDDWIADAITHAHSIDPSAELWLNEYGSDWVPGKHEALLALVRGLVNRGVPIDGVGLQTHRLPGDPIDPERLRNQLRDFTALSLKVAITELDIPVSPADPAALEWQAAQYGAVVAVCLAVDGCVEITIWGLGDGSTWLDALGLFPTPTRPLLFDTALAPKPAYTEVRSALASALLQPPTVATDAVENPPADTLPVTGSATTSLASTASILLIAGAALVMTTGRRCASHHD